MGIFSKFFSFTQELAIDLGTANTIIISDGEIAVNEPSVVALDTHSEKNDRCGRGSQAHV